MVSNPVADFLLVERSVVQLDVVAPYASEACEDLREGGDDEVLAVPERKDGSELMCDRQGSGETRRGRRYVGWMGQELQLY